MVKPIMKDVFFLNQKSEPSTEADKATAQDLRDTLAAHKHECVGMAANMIGVRKNIIIVDTGLMPLVMHNPVIVSKEGSFDTEESCLSLIGARKVTRYQEIEVEYQDMNFNKKKGKFTGWTAQIIQHECDHLQGIII